MLKLLPDLKDCDILADKAYGTKEIRTYLHDQSARYTISPKVNTKQPWSFDILAHFAGRFKPAYYLTLTKNKRFSTLRCTKAGSTQLKRSAACFAVQSCLADADFVVFSIYCLIGIRLSTTFLQNCC